MEYLGYSSSLTPSIVILTYSGKTRKGVPKPSLGLCLVPGIVAGVQSGGWYTQLLSLIGSYRHHWKCSTRPLLVVMATNASLPLFIWHLISRSRHYCPFIHKMPLEGKYPLFQPKDNGCFYLCHSNPAQLHVMAFHSPPPLHCSYQLVPSSQNLSTSSTFNWNI